MKSPLLPLALLASLATNAHSAVVLTFDQFTTDGAAPNYGSRVALSGANYLDLGARNFNAFVTNSSPTPGITASWSSGMRFDGVTSTPGNQYGAPGDKLLKVAYNNANDGTLTTGFQGVTFQADAGQAISLLSLRVATDAVFSTSTFSLRIQTSPNGTDWTTQYQNFTFGAVANSTYTLDATTTLDALSRSVAINSPEGGFLRIETNKKWSLVMDNITIAQIPEPSTTAALGGIFAMGALVSLRRRARR